MKWQEDADGRAVLLRFAIALDADPPGVPLDELPNSCADRSPALDSVLTKVERVAPTDATVLVLGSIGQ